MQRQPWQLEEEVNTPTNHSAFFQKVFRSRITQRRGASSPFCSKKITVTAIELFIHLKTICCRQSGQTTKS